MSGFPQVPGGRLERVIHDFSLDNGWVKMPIEAILLNPRLTGQSRQLWGWLASLQVYRGSAISWVTCEHKMNCGTSARRKCLAVLVDEGFISVSRDGKVVTMHDPEKVYEKSRKRVVDYICDECDQLKFGKQKPTPKPVIQQEIPVKKTFNITEEILEIWNTSKPETYSKIRAVSSKQREAVAKHLKNLGLQEVDVGDLITSVCRGLSKNNFWMTTINPSQRTFNAVFGYGSPNDKKMKNVEDLYLAGDSSTSEVPAEEKIEHSKEQKELLQQLQAIDYQLEMSDPSSSWYPGMQKKRELIAKELEAIGVKVEG